MKLLKEYFELQKKIYDYFGYVEDWKVIPIEDGTEFYWCSDEENNIYFADKKEHLFDGSGNYYHTSIYQQRFLPKFDYKTDKYTMICSDTHTDGNKFLAIFDNSKRIDFNEFEEY